MFQYPLPHFLLDLVMRIPPPSCLFIILHVPFLLAMVIELACFSSRGKKLTRSEKPFEPEALKQIDRPQ